MTPQHHAAPKKSGSSSQKATNACRTLDADAQLAFEEKKENLESPALDEVIQIKQ
jgi:hypothetical protein